MKRTDARYDRLRAIVAYAVEHAEANGFDVAYNGVGSRCLCPNGAVALLAHRSQRFGEEFVLHRPMCDESALAYAYLLGGKPADWMDEARALEVGFDGSDPKEEQVRVTDRFYLLGKQYREERVP